MPKERMKVSLQKRILLVDDDPTVRDSLSDVFVAEGYSVIPAANGQQALDLANRLPADLVLLDLNMPKMNGIEFLQVVKNDDAFKRIPVIVLTTSKDEQDRVNTFGLGVAGYMIKPVDYLQFVEVVRAIDLYWTLSELSD